MNDEAQSQVIVRYLWSRGSIRLLWRWCLEAWSLWLMLAGFVGSFCVAVLLAAEWAIRLRYTGVALQGMGLLVIILGFNKLRIELGRAGFLTEIWKSIKRLGRVFYRKQRAGVTVGVASGAATMAGAGEVTAGPRTIEQRVKALEKDFATFRQEQRELHGAIDSRLSQLADESRREHHTLKQQLEHTHLSGLTAELVAVVWLLVGMVLAAVPESVAGLLGL